MACRQDGISQAELIRLHGQADTHLAFAFDELFGKDPDPGLRPQFNLFSSAIKLNTQYMHSIWFNLRVQRVVTKDEVLDKLQANPYVA